MRPEADTGYGIAERTIESSGLLMTLYSHQSPQYLTAAPLRPRVHPSRGVDPEITDHRGASEHRAGHLYRCERMRLAPVRGRPRRHHTSKIPDVGREMLRTHHIGYRNPDRLADRLRVR